MTFKRIIALLLLLVIASLSLLSCTEGQYIGPSGGGQGSGSGGDGDDEEFTPPVMNNDPTDDFTVTLLVDGQPYSPRMEMLAYWTDGYSIHAAKFDKTGVARIDGLDGDYRVTLSAVPNELTYDPNSNIATNDERNIVLELYTLNILTGLGTGQYSGHSISKTGVYSATLNSAEEGIFFMYSPTENGIYTIESWTDTSADNINPYVDIYIGTFAWNQYSKTIDDGGSQGSYTVNFKHDVRLTEDQVGNNYIFAVKADSRTGKYPITVTFAIKRDGGFDYPTSSADTIDGIALPTYDFTGFDKSEHEYGNEYKLTNPEYILPGTSTPVFDESRFKLWDDAGGDGFYHLYDEVKYASTGGYGPILYAYMNTASRFIDRPFTKIEYKGDSSETLNGALKKGGKNYKVLLEGYTYLSTVGSVNDGGYFCVSTCPCQENNTSGKHFACIATRDENGSLVKCPECDSGCRPCPVEFIDHIALFEDGAEILDSTKASIEMSGGVPVSIVLNGVSYSLKLKEGTRADGSIIAAVYEAYLGDAPAFELTVTDTTVSCTVDGASISFTYVLGFRGYKHYANSDGLVPVTEEIRDFLYAYCTEEAFFYDGTGSLENSGYQAVGESGWLFACAYYELKE